MATGGRVLLRFSFGGRQQRQQAAAAAATPRPATAEGAGSVIFAALLERISSPFKFTPFPYM
jgi:hypothetical protein